MAWQIVVVKLTGESPLIQEPSDDQSIPLGTPDEVRRQISNCLPSVDWSDPRAGRVIPDDEGFTLTFKVRDKEIVTGFVIDVRGDSAAMPILIKVAKANGWQLYDCSASWIDLDNPSYAGWEGYDRLRRAHLNCKPQDD